MDSHEDIKITITVENADPIVLTFKPGSNDIFLATAGTGPRVDVLATTGAGTPVNVVVTTNRTGSPSPVDNRADTRESEEELIVKPYPWERQGAVGSPKVFHDDEEFYRKPNQSVPTAHDVATNQSVPTPGNVATDKKISASSIVTTIKADKGTNKTGATSKTDNGTEENRSAASKDDDGTNETHGAAVQQSSKAPGKLQCVHCKEMIAPETNTNDACKYHPGEYKGTKNARGLFRIMWLCCDAEHPKAEGCQVDYHQFQEASTTTRGTKRRASDSETIDERKTKAVKQVSMYRRYGTVEQNRERGFF
ncbi:hypothetical protein GGR57DRAFT_502365 [Xylariaceae sp. FL1272]|nr:hypothetical protein GGR57DRAFT_502365 [Xylariaceae sp. FL1272]